MAHQRVTSEAMIRPTISESAEWRLGIAAYGFEASWMRPLPWFRLAKLASVSTKPTSGNIRGGAVGRKT